MSSRIKEVLSRKKKPKLLVPFFTVGYPDIKTNEQLIYTAVDNGADMIELGIPFSDPMADGPEIQYSSFEALKRGVTLNNAFRLVSKIREKIDTPLIFMGYYNPVHSIGIATYMKKASTAGVDGHIIPDLPVDESRDFIVSSIINRQSAVFLASPTSSVERWKKIDRASSDFVYAVTVTGVTGANKKFGSDTDKYLKQLSSVLKKPFVAGFGVSNAETAKRLTKYADGVVIGSALVKKIRDAKTKKDAVISVGNLLRTIRRAI